DRGDGEQAIIDLFTKLETEARAAGGNVIVLNGNHELMNAALDFRYVTPGGMADFDGPQGRAKALMPGGTYAKVFAKHNAIAIVGYAIFSHAGVLGDWVAQVDAVNTSTRCYLDGQLHDPPPAARGEDTPLWTRAVGMPDVDCASVTAALTTLGVKRMIVGHTVQRDGISSKCDDALWRIDVGLAKLYDGPIQVLEVYPTPKILTGTRP
ncbi:MAG: calcineurin, partial [Proteobacteria bacterium]|nr:calcineurin [Pseudomonadota bacterium]